MKKKYWNLLKIYNINSKIWDSCCWKPLNPSFVVLDHGLSLSVVDAACIENDGWDDVWINIWSWSSIFNITSSIVMHYLSWDSEWSSSVSCSVWKFVDAWGLVDSCKSFVVVGSVKRDVKGVFGIKLFHHLVNVVHSSWTISHNRSGEIGVASWSIPVWENFWLETNWKVMFFSASLQEISSSPKVVSLFNTKAWSNLEFPLSRENLSVCSWYFDSSI